MIATECIRPGLHRIIGVVHVRCGGGELRVERCGHGDWRWETFCENCGICDCNGWPTLAKCVEEAPGFFAQPAKGEVGKP